MKKITLSALIIMTSIISLQAQLYTPPGTVLGNSLNSNIGIGTETPSEKLSVFGYHGDTRFLLHSEGGREDKLQADLMLWASEPGLTYTGVGIGNNVHNFNNSLGGISLLNKAKGGSYIRLLDNAMSFNVISSAGVDKQALSIDSNGSIGIGTIAPAASVALDVNGKTFVRSLLYVNDIMGGNGGDIRMGPNTGANSSTIFMIGGANPTEIMRISYNENVGIGTKNPDEKLTVKGKIHAEEVRIDLNFPAPDYVFANDYKLKSLQEVEEFIKQNSHLPEIPSAKEIEKNGLMLAEMNMNLLKKIEELTLYSISQSKEIESSKVEIQILKKENQAFKSLSERLSKIENQLK